MREFAGRIMSLDPQTSEAFKAIAFFDELIASGVGGGSILRGAAYLAGVTAGAEYSRRRRRIGPDGQEPIAAADCAWPSREFAGGCIWIERTGAAHANDSIILERAALALEIATMRGEAGGGNAVALAVDAEASLPRRLAALERLRIPPSAQVRLVATATETRIDGLPSVVMPTRLGLCRIVIDHIEHSISARAGIGRWTRADEAHLGLASAVAAYALTSESEPRVDAASLGDLLTLVLDRRPSSDDDTRTLTALSDDDLALCDALVGADSIRAAAASLGLHHSTAGARHAAIVARWGWDPRSPIGRARYIVARLRLRLYATDAPTG